MIGKRSITWRLTLLFGIVTSAVLLALGLLIVSAVEQHFEQQDLDELKGKLELIRHTLDELNPQDDFSTLQHTLIDSLVGHSGLEAAIFNMKREELFATANANFPVELVASSTTASSTRPVQWTAQGQPYRGIFAELSRGVSERPTVIVAVAVNIAHHQAFVRSFLRTLWILGLCAAALTGVLGWFATRYGLAPVLAMSAQTQAITAQHLNQRLPLETMPVELIGLARSLNLMLERLEEAFFRLTSFSSDIAHELRTPVSSVMTQTQVALSRPRTADVYRGILESNVEEFERMARMISDMLLLAKAENGMVVLNREIVSLPDEIRALFDFYDAVAKDKGLQLTFEGGGEVCADRLMLRRALGNLLSNAIRHSSENATIRVTIRTVSSETTEITVDNTGDVILQEFWERIFERFYRVDPSRQRTADGTGLGLAIAKSIVIAHGGTISVHSDTGMTRFTVTLPERS